MSKKITKYIKEYRCLHCGKQVTTNECGKLSDLTPKLKEINHTLEVMYQKRMLKRSGIEDHDKNVA